MRTRRPGFRWFDLPTHVRYGLACAAFALTGCAADWRDRSVLSPSDAAQTDFLHSQCMAELLFPHGAPPQPDLQGLASVCADITHRTLCHARIATDCQ